MRVRLQVRGGAGPHLGLPTELLRVVHGELDGAIVAGLRVESAQRVAVGVLARELVGELREQLGALRGFVRVDLLAGSDAIEGEGRELLLQPGVLPTVDGTGLAQRIRGAVVVARGFPHLRLVPIQRDLPLRVVDQRELHREVGDRVVPHLRALEQLAQGVDRVLATGVVLDRPAVVVDRLLGLGERRLGPQPGELLVQPRDVGAHLRVAVGEGRQGLGPTFLQRHQRLGIALVPIQRRQPLGRRGLGGIAVDSDHERARGAVGIAQRLGPNLGSFRQPVARKRRVTRGRTHLLEKHRV